VEALSIRPPAAAAGLRRSGDTEGFFTIPPDAGIAHNRCSVGPAACGFSV